MVITPSMVSRPQNGIPKRLQDDARALEIVAQRVSTTMNKNTLEFAILTNDSAQVRAAAVRRLGEICFDEKKGATRGDYAIFRMALHDLDPKIMKSAQLALQKDRSRESVFILISAMGDSAHPILQSLACDVIGGFYRLGWSSDQAYGEVSKWVDEARKSLPQETVRIADEFMARRFRPGC